MNPRVPPETFTVATASHKLLQVTSSNEVIAEESILGSVIKSLTVTTQPLASVISTEIVPAHKLDAVEVVSPLFHR